MTCAWNHPSNVAKWWSSKVSVASGLSRCKCYASDEASHLLDEIDIPAFRTNTLILECPQQTAMVHASNKLQGLDRTSPQWASRMDELLHSTTEMHTEHCLHFYWINEVTTRRKGHTPIIPHRRFWIVNVPHGQSSEFRVRSTLIKEEVLWTGSIQ